MASKKSTTTIASWNGHKFKVTKSLIYAMKTFTLKGSSETEEKGKKGVKIVSKKNSKPYEISFTVQLNRMLGVKKVKQEAVKWVNEARNGAQDYIYLNGKKLIACKFMLTEASVSETMILPNGEWMACEIKCTFKQSSLWTAKARNRAASITVHRAAEKEQRQQEYRQRQQRSRC